ncbi:Polyprotein, related [Eimeria brunetti]|uniref:Polyprotein, related n=1 Tax=Eimeria brunetti TaxID=51314 RepID=U6LGD0_9EIME|nr:Polyprotein, related [Eimeria brunetti]
MKAWPEVLENETQIRQFLGTVNYCRMFMGPDFARVARPLVDLTRKGVPFQWTDAHTQAVRHLKQRLVDYATLQIPDTTKPFELYTDASGYAIGAVLEQASQPIGFLSQAMIPTQQKYSIYDQELLALVSALDNDPPNPPHKTRGTHTDYRKLAGLRRRSSRKRSPSPPVPPLTPTPSPAPESPTPADPPPTPSSPVLDWPAAYSKCPVFSEPYHTASHKPDRDPRFQSEVWTQLCSRFNITRAMSSAYHPQTDGQTERVNRTLEQMLRTYIQADEREWEGLLPALELAYNTTSHSSTELSPFEIMIGENPLTAADLDIVRALAPTLTPPMTKLFRRLCDRAQGHILKAKW